jgi:hypothetical protein
VARAKLQPEREVVARCETLRADLHGALDRLTAAPSDPALIEAVWQGEALGTLLWALQLAELPAYDEPFVPEEVAAVDVRGGELRDAEEIELERESARLWHWRARTVEVQADPSTRLPERFASFDQLVASVAMRGYEQGLLPEPARGDFSAYGTGYRGLARDQLAEAHAVAVERHHALAWLTSPGTPWGEVPLDT